MRTLVIGLGNPILTDDGVGIYTARILRSVLPPSSRLEVIELSVGGLALMEAMIGYDHVYLIDALWPPDDNVGQVVLFDAGDLKPTLNTNCTHDVNLPTALEIGYRLHLDLPHTDNIQIIGMWVQDVYSFGETPTPPVLAAVPELAETVLELLGIESTDIKLYCQQILIGGYDDFS